MSVPSLVYNGTAPTGGDSSISWLKLRLIISHVQSQFMVLAGRCCVGLGLDGFGLAYDSRSGIFLFRAGKTKVCPITHLVIISLYISSIVSGISRSPSSLTFSGGYGDSL